MALLWLAAVLAAGGLAYHNSLEGEFLLDDDNIIVQNRNIRGLTPASRHFASPQAPRPLVNFSLALNYHWGGLKDGAKPNPGFHVFNLIVHLVAAAALYGIVRRTLLTERLRGRFGSASAPLAAAVAGLWAVHPLTTQAVTYVVQRGESMMAAFFLLMLYCSIRGRSARWAWAAVLWYAGSLVACAAGMASKEVMVVAPIAVGLYHLVFDVRPAGPRGRGIAPLCVHLVSLAATWLLLAALVQGWGDLPGVPPPEDARAGFGTEGLTPWLYARTQFAVLLYYFKLTFWPGRLCLDYGWEPVAKPLQWIPHAVAVLALLGASVYGLIRRKPAGFAGFVFFLILAPTSTILPIEDVIFEHRMYLPLAAVVSLVVLGGWWLVGAVSARLGEQGRSRPALPWAFVALVVLAGAALTWRTLVRNWTYCDAIAMYKDVLKTNPDSYRVHGNLGKAYYDTAETIDDEAEREALIRRAMEHHRHAIGLKEDYGIGMYNMGLAHQTLGQDEKAIKWHLRALKVHPWLDSAYLNIGVIYTNRNEYDRAALMYKEALRVDPQNVLAMANLGRILLARGQRERAVEFFGRAARLKRDFLGGRLGYAEALLITGRLDEAETELREMTRYIPVERMPAHRRAFYHLIYGRVAIERGRWDQAIELLQRAIDVEPDYAPAYVEMGKAYRRMARSRDAERVLKQALSFDPDQPAAHYHLGLLYKETMRPQLALNHLAAAARGQVDRGGMPDAIRSLEALLEIAPGRDDARRMLADLQANLNRDADARKQYEVLLARSKDPAVAINLAWVLATSPDPAVADPRRAVALAEAACRARGTRDARWLMILASAYARAGRMDAAVRLQRRAIEALPEDLPEQVHQFEERLKLYAAGEPYVRTPASEDPARTDEGS
jgi:tetratricopeptide (TPR) repeat protein